MSERTVATMTRPSALRYTVVPNGYEYHLCVVRALHGSSQS